MATYIVEGTNNLNRLVTDVLNYSRPIQLKFEKTDLIPLIEEIRQHVLIDADISTKIQITIKSKIKSLIISLDSQLIKSVLLNLIVNAIQAMPEGGNIVVEVNKNENFALIDVSDTGMGIQTENIEKIYSPFYTTKPHGHGFGLSEVYKIIQGHQGSIEVQSTVNKGTTFMLKLPLRV